MEHDIDINLKSKKGETALDLASKIEDQDIRNEIISVLKGIDVESKPKVKPTVEISNKLDNKNILIDAIGDTLNNNGISSDDKVIINLLSQSALSASDTGKSSIPQVPIIDQNSNLIVYLVDQMKVPLKEYNITLTEGLIKILTDFFARILKYNSDNKIGINSNDVHSSKFQDKIDANVQSIKQKTM